MLVELKLVEQRYRAVIDVLDGMSVTDVARRNGVSRQSVHTWLRHYANGGMAALADKSSKPETCPHQMPPVIEARVVELRRAHPRWGPRSIRTYLAKEGFSPLPGRSSIYRTLVRHHLLEPTQRKRSRSDYKRWERSRSMELWQMDVVGRFHLAGGTEVKIITGVDDHSRFCVCARVVARATARPVCEALQWALRTHGVPDQILTDNGKVFTARFGQGPGPVLFDRICANNGIRHLLTAPYSPTTTGKVERFHKTMPRGLLGRPRPDAPQHRSAAGRPRRMGRRVQHDAATPVPRRSPTHRALRLGGRAPSGRRSRDARGARRGRAFRAPARRQPLGRPTWLDRTRWSALSSRTDLCRRRRRGGRARRSRRDPPRRCPRRHPRRAAPRRRQISPSSARYGSDALVPRRAA